MKRLLAFLFLSLTLTIELQADNALPRSVSEKMVVVASKSLRPIEDVVGSVTRIGAEEIRDIQASNFDDLFQFQPNISMESTGNRFQSSSINVRGIGENRIAIEVDGIPSTDQFDIGSYANNGRLLPEIDLIRQVEILNGPASTLYGSDAIGGIVSISTWDPVDLLQSADSNHFYKIRGGYEGKTHSQVMTGISAWQWNGTGLLLSATKRMGKGINNDDFIDEPTDKLDWSSESFFAKATLNIGNFDKLTLTFHASANDTRSEMNSLVGIERFEKTTVLSGDDHTESYRFSLKYEFSTDNVWFGDNTLNLYYLESQTNQNTTELRTSFGMPVRQLREFSYEQEVLGFEFFTTNSIKQQSVNHNLVYGIDTQITRTTERRNARQLNLVNGNLSQSLLGETFPLRDFPKSTTVELGLYAQDQIEISEKWSIVPAIRFDAYRLLPNIDAAYRQNEPGRKAISITETSFSPKMGVLHHFNGNRSIFAQYVHGFRAPPYEEANIALNIPFLNTRALPNPHLKPEQSNGLEIGFRQLDRDNEYEMTLFYTHFKDFIESKSLVGVDDSGSFLFQSRNLNRAEIYGIELRTSNKLSLWQDKFDGWQLDTRWALTRGNNLENGEPLNTISPAQVIFDLGWHNSNRQWKLNLIGTFTAAKKRVDETAGLFFKPDGHGIFDVLLHYQPTSKSTLSFGLFNLTNKRYWRWQDVRNVSSYSQIIDSVTRPERHLSLSLSISW